MKLIELYEINPIISLPLKKRSYPHELIDKSLCKETGFDVNHDHDHHTWRGRLVPPVMNGYQGDWSGTKAINCV